MQIVGLYKYNNVPVLLLLVGFDSYMYMHVDGTVAGLSGNTASGFDSAQL